MRFAVHLSPRIREDEHYEPVRRAVTEQALDGDRAGIDAILLTEHHLSTHNPYQNPLMFGAALAPQLRQAHMVLATINPAIYQPLRLVESLNLLDQMMEGRLIVAFGPGYVDYELEVFGRKPSERALIYRDSLATVLRLWNMKPGDPPFEFDAAGERGVVHRTVLPQPFRKPHPILARATLTESTMVDTAKLGWAVLFAGPLTVEDIARRMKAYRDTLESSGHSAETVRNARSWSGLTRWVHVARTDEEAEKQITTTIVRWLSDRRDTIVATDPAISSRLGGDSAKLGVQPADPAAFRRQVIFGSPKSVIEQVRRLEEAGVGMLISTFMRDVEEMDEVRASFRLFCDEVLPAFRA